jgi:undecaprenyl-diphosphatase
MTALQAILTAILQGVTELFPVSSLGHAVVLPRLVGWHIDQQGDSYLPFLVVLHIGTATALLAYFWRDWLALATSFVGVGDAAERRQNWRLTGLIVVATIPAVILGFALEKLFRTLFGAPAVAAGFLIASDCGAREASAGLPT